MKALADARCRLWPPPQTTWCGTSSRHHRPHAPNPPNAMTHVHGNTTADMAAGAAASSHTRLYTNVPAMHEQWQDKSRQGWPFVQHHTWKLPEDGCKFRSLSDLCKCHCLACFSTCHLPLTPTIAPALWFSLKVLPCGVTRHSLLADQQHTVSAAAVWQAPGWQLQWQRCQAAACRSPFPQPSAQQRRQWLQLRRQPGPWAAPFSTTALLTWTKRLQPHFRAGGRPLRPLPAILGSARCCAGLLPVARCHMVVAGGWASRLGIKPWRRPVSMHQLPCMRP